jgi:hypothetical protein
MKMGVDIPGIRRRAQSPDCLAAGLRTRNASIICCEKAVLYLGYYAARYKHVHAFLKVYECRKTKTNIHALIANRTHDLGVQAIKVYASDRAAFGTGSNFRPVLVF